MRLRLISALIAVSALAACATQVPMPPAGSAATASAPAPTPGYDWFLNTDGQEAMLAYEVKLRLACQVGSSALELTASSDKPGREIYLESGGDTERYRAASEPAVVHDGELLTAQAKTKDPVFQRFRRLGWIAAWADGERHVYAAHPAAKVQIERFFTVCG